MKENNKQEVEIKCIGTLDPRLQKVIGEHYRILDENPELLSQINEDIKL